MKCGAFIDNPIQSHEFLTAECGKPATRFYLIEKYRESMRFLLRCHEHPVFDLNEINREGYFLNGYEYREISQEEYFTFELLNS
jgi:hypothetical protein